MPNKSLRHVGQCRISPAYLKEDNTSKMSHFQIMPLTGKHADIYMCVHMNTCVCTHIDHKTVYTKGQLCGHW